MTLRDAIALCACLTLSSACNESVEVGTLADEEPEPQPEAQPEGQPEAQPEAQPEQTPEPQPEAQPEAEPEVDPGCVDDGACEPGEICQEGLCVQGCRDNEGCSSGTICDQGQCVECRDDSDCIIGTVCEAHACLDGCRDDEGCLQGAICQTGQCELGCRGDEGCDEGSICQGEVCVQGCRGDEGCEGGLICEGDACVEGCRDDSGCATALVCEGVACVAGCRDDAGCATGDICQSGSCVSGCRGDGGCGLDQLCLGLSCVFRGIGCRGDGDCGDSEVCDLDAERCAPGQEPCQGDAFEPNDTEASASLLGQGSQGGLTICEGDVDVYAINALAGEVVDVVWVFNHNAGALRLRLGAQDATPNVNGASASVTAQESGLVLITVEGVGQDTRNSYSMTIEVTEVPACVDTTLYADTDADGFGAGSSPLDVCLEEGEGVEGYARAQGDCGPNDPLRNPDAQEICGDWVDDDCDGPDAACPTSQPTVNVPEWDCAGAPPSNVVAWARFDDGGGYFRDGGCFFFFEGAPGEFYSKRQIERSNTSPSCESYNGCTCPSLNGWASYDRRMYAFTLTGAVEDCAQISIRDHGGERQPVSNACRKYLYQMHQYNIPFSFVASSLEALQQRIALQPRVEIACVEDAPHRNLPFQSLVTAPIEVNPSYRPQ